MAGQFVSERNLRFMLYEVLDAEALCRLPAYAEHSREVFDLALATGLRLGRELFYPCFSEMDKNPPVYAGGEVRVHPAVRRIMKECGEGGWIGAQFPVELGGQQMPNLVMSAFRFILSAANYSAAVYPFLTMGAAHLIATFGSPDLIATYVPRMLDGSWQGTMALTEPQAGSSLADLSTTATPTGRGYYLLKGQKIFISAAEHDGADNVVNLLLARITGAPAGVKGISLFVVPKFRPAGDGGLERNDIVCAGIYHKLGYRGSPITQLALGENNDCRGFLVGEPHQGLKYMFQMMNEARLDVGLSAAAIASAAYYAALAYARERTQGRKITEKDPAKPQIPIIEHADVKRMLLFQRAVVEGSLALLLECAKYVDLAHHLSGEDAEKYALLLDLLTPVAKSYPSETGNLAVSAALQCLGGYGYCDEFPLEQYFRDERIHPIHEGTTGIQGLDLLGRKVLMKNGKAFFLYLAELAETVDQAKKMDELATHALALEAAVSRLQTVTNHLTGLALKGEIELFLADATLYLEFFGIIALAWQWLKQAIVALQALRRNPPQTDLWFYQGKVHACRYFFAYELGKTLGLAERLLNSDGLTVNMKTEFFQD